MVCPKNEVIDQADLMLAFPGFSRNGTRRIIELSRFAKQGLEIP